MKRKLIWTFPSPPSTQNKFSNEWLIEAKDINIPLPHVNGSDVWLMHKHHGRLILFGHIRVILIAQQGDKLYDGFLVLCTDKCASFRIAPYEAASTDWELHDVSNVSGMRVAEQSEIKQIKKLIKKNKRVKLASPSALLDLPGVLETTTPMSMARLLYGHILSTRSLSELSYSRNGNTPFGKLAVLTASERFQNLELHNHLRDMDAAVMQILQGDSTDEKIVGAGGVRGVDIDLVPAMPNEIVSRVLVESDDVYPTKREIQEKIQDAENRHQEIVKQIARALLAMNVAPTQNSSVDLAAYADDTLFLFEVKSATTSNFNTQTKKAFTQLLEYKMAFEHTGQKHISPVAIVEHVSDTASRQRYLSEFANYLGIKIIWYKKQQATDELRKLFGKTKR